MIIKKIHIDGFGIFRDFSIGDLKKGVNILYGRNEAGKSTLLDFLRYTLFGYPRSRADHRDPLNGGKHGGRIMVLAGDPAREVTFERFAGSKGGPFRLLTPGGESSDRAEWDRWLGFASDDLYQNVYAFSLDELVSLDSLSRSGVEDRIFSIGLGLGDLSLGEVEKGFQEESDAIYSPRGRNQKVPQLLGRISELNEKVKTIQGHLPYYQALTTEIRELEEETGGLTRVLQEHRTSQAQLENYHRCYAYYVRINQAGKELAELPPLKELPDGGIGRLNELEAEEEALNKQVRAITDGRGERKGIQALQQELEGIHFNTGLLKQKETVDYLRENLTLYKQETRNKEADVRRAEELDEQVRRGVLGIGPEWTEEYLAAFGDLAGKQAKLKSFKSGLEELALKKRELEAEGKVLRSREGRLNMKAAAALVAGLAMVAAGAFFYLGQHIWGVALVVMAGILFFGRNFLPREGAYQLVLNRLKELEAKEETLRQQLGDYLESELLLNRALDPDAALEIIGRVEKLQSQVTERDSLVKSVQETRDPLITGYEKKVHAVRALLNDGIAESSLGRVSEPGVEAAADLEAAGNNSEITGNNIEIAVNQLVSAFEDARERSVKKQRLQEALEMGTRELKTAQKELDEVGGKIDLLLKGIGADDRQTFRDVYEKNERVKTLNDQVRETREAMEVIVGWNKADEVMAYLNAHEKAAIEERIRELKDEADAISERLKQMSEDLGGKKREIQDMEGESDLAEAMTALETEKEKLQLAYREWLTNKLALSILGDVKTRFEQEKQPEVIQYSSRYFKKITNDRYESIRVSLGQKEVGVFDPRGVSRGIDQLSRGTREQLLVSLRLGFIEAYEKKAEALPIIMDEILVNFDSERAHKTAEILQEFAKERQILMLTCHEGTADFFKTPAVFKLSE
jgi:uncharacterized protein YhaN